MSSILTHSTTFQQGPITVTESLRDTPVIEAKTTVDLLAALKSAFPKNGEFTVGASMGRSAASFGAPPSELSQLDANWTPNPPDLVVSNLRTWHSLVRKGSVKVVRRYGECNVPVYVLV